MAKTTPFIMFEGEAAINKAIASIKRRGASLQNDMHKAAVSCLAHADKHGNVTPMRNLLEAVPNAVRKNALRSWAEQFGKFTWNDTTKTLDFDKSKSTTLDAAIAEPFWQWQPEAAYKPLDLKTELAKLLKRVDTARKHGDAMPEDTVAVLQALKDGKTVTVMVDTMPEPAGNTTPAASDPVAKTLAKLAA